MNSYDDALKIIIDLIDEDDCSIDHHGYCQSHGWFDNSECPHSRAKKLLDSSSADHK